MLTIKKMMENDCFFFTPLIYLDILWTKGAIDMAQAMVNFRMDADLKSAMEDACRKMGLTMADAFTMFAVKVVQDRRIPFEITADPTPYDS